MSIPLALPDERVAGGDASNAIVFATGEIPATTMARVGLVFDLLMGLLITLVSSCGAGSCSGSDPASRPGPAADQGAARGAR